MDVAFVCNAGLLLRYEGKALIVDAPNSRCSPFYMLPQEDWQRLCEEDICGFFFTHVHPDHFDHDRLQSFLERDPVPCFVPNNDKKNGSIEIGPFKMEYHYIDHAPIDRAPEHVSVTVSAGDNTLYIAADAKLDVPQHEAALKGKVADIGIWNAMYLSRKDTRDLMKRAAKQNFIYHMPLKPEGSEIWKKCERNFERYSEELSGVTVIDQYPFVLEI